MNNRINSGIVKFSSDAIKTIKETCTKKEVFEIRKACSSLKKTKGTSITIKKWPTLETDSFMMRVKASKGAKDETVEYPMYNSILEARGRTWFSKKNIARIITAVKKQVTGE